MLYLICFALPALVLARPPAAFVVGGADADEGEWPWQMSLQYLGSHSCGASLVAATKAVTAAHCVGNAIVSYNLVFGTNQRSCPNDTCTTRKPTGYTRHPDFVNNGNVGYPNDVATIAWAVPVTPVVGKIQFVALATTTGQEGRTCYITGWGRLTGGGALPENLQEAQIDLLTTAECQALWTAEQVSDSHVCVYDKTNQAKGACNGDSGGPLVCQTTGPAARWELVGATSWGRTGCGTTYPSVYTRISSYTAWINEQ